MGTHHGILGLAGGRRLSGAPELAGSTGDNKIHLVQTNTTG